MAQTQPHFGAGNPGFPPDEVKTFAMFVHNGDLAMMKLELQSNPGLIDAKDANGSPMLHVAVEWAQEEAVGLLLQRGADPKAVDEFGRTADTLATLLNFTPLAEKICARRTAIEKAENMKRDYDAAVLRFTVGAPRPSESMRATFKPKKRVL